jgi:hypothetical protein
LKVLTFRFGITVTKMTASQKKRNAGLKQQGIMMYTVAKGSNAANDVLKKTARSIEDELERAKALSLETKRREDKLPDSEPQMEVGTPSKKLIKTNRNRMPDLRLKSIKKRNLKWRPTLRGKNDPKTDCQCRTLLKKLLDDNSLDALPGHSKAKDVVGHKFVDLQVRKKAERRLLPAFECADCRNFYARANLDEDQLRDLLQVTLLS